MIGEDLKKTGRCHFSVAKENFMLALAGFILPKNSPYTKEFSLGYIYLPCRAFANKICIHLLQFNYRIMKMEQFGLIDYWWRLQNPTDPSPCLSKNIKKKKKSEANGRPAEDLKRLTLKDLSGAFVVLIVGYIISLLVLVIERSIGRMKKDYQSNKIAPLQSNIEESKTFEDKKTTTDDPLPETTAGSLTQSDDLKVVFEEKDGGIVVDPRTKPSTDSNLPKMIADLPKTKTSVDFKVLIENIEEEITSVDLGSEPKAHSLPNIVAESPTKNREGEIDKKLIKKVGLDEELTGETIKNSGDLKVLVIDQETDNIQMDDKGIIDSCPKPSSDSTKNPIISDDADDLNAILKEIEENFKMGEDFIPTIKKSTAAETLPNFDKK